MRRQRGTARRDRIRRARPGVESLEGRALLSAGASGRPAVRLGPLVQVSGASPFGPDFDGAVGNSAVEPRVAIDPRHPNHLVGVWQQDRFASEGALGTGVAVSFDGGRSWRTSVIPGITSASGGTFDRASDPYVSFGRHGVVYVSSLAFNEVSATGAGGESTVYVSQSNDAGRTFGPPTALVNETSPLRGTDKESITADPFRPRYAYAAWEPLGVPPTLLPFTGPATFTRTTDGGRTWEPSRTIYDPGANAITINHHLFVRPNGELIDAFTLFRLQLGRGPLLNSQLAILRSGDRGRTWGAVEPVTDFSLNGVPVVDPDTGAPIRTSSTPSGLPAQFVDVTVDPRDGNLYAVWQDARFSGGQYDGIAFSMSTDGGRHWSSPVEVNQPPTGPGIDPRNLQAFDPTVAVARDGTIGVSFYDFRNNTPAPGALADAWLVVGRATGRRGSIDWGAPIRLTDQSFDIEKAPRTTGGLTGGGYFLGDYEGLTATDGGFLAFFSQPTGDFPAAVVSRRAEVGRARG